MKFVDCSFGTESKKSYSTQKLALSKILNQIDSSADILVYFNNCSDDCATMDSPQITRL